MRLSTVFCLVALLLAPAVASAGLINGGFETRDFTGWTQSGDTGFTGVGSGAHSGLYAAVFGPTGSLGYISQTLVTTPGASYVVDYWLSAGGGGANQFQFIWGGIVLQNLLNLGAPGYTHYSYNVTALSASTTISFGFYYPSDFWYFDDAAVNDASNGVPEPATIGLVAAALLGLVALRRRAA
jgi:hypothetical protein